MTQRKVDIDASWLVHLQSEFEQEYMQHLRHFLASEKAAGKTIYPAGKHIFNALNAAPLSEVKVIILGQDPYHGPGQAHGLCFSVPEGVPQPPSLKNILKELSDDLAVPLSSTGCLQSWAEQGVLLLNAVLTVEHKCAAAHAGKGWERFTDRVIQVLNEERENLVFMLWGSYAQKKGQFIDASRHKILQAPHPSPLSAHRGFFGCRHFSQANEYLQQSGLSPVNWTLPD